MSVTGDTLSPDRSRQVMIDLGANAGAILAIAAALYLPSRVVPAMAENSPEAHRAARVTARFP
jgi:precorrin-6B methylase 2